MNVIDTLVTDRTQAHVTRLAQLSAKGWERMTENERHEWTFGNETIDWADGERITCLDGDVLVDGVSNKGAYNAIDLNRVGEAMLYLKSRYDVFGYAAPISPKTDWTLEDIPTPEQLKRYLDDVSALRKAMELPPTTPSVPPDMDGLTAEEANDIERILTDIETTLLQVAAAFKRSNAPSFWSGNDPLPTAENYMGRTWEELDAMGTTWANWQVADWYLLLYGNLKAEGEVTNGV